MVGMTLERFVRNRLNEKAYRRGKRHTKFFNKKGDASADQLFEKGTHLVSKVEKGKACKK